MAIKVSRKGVRRWISAVLTGYVLVGAALYFLQEKFLFHPKVLDADHQLAISQPFEEVRIPVSDEKLIHITRFPVADSVRRGLVIYFHGNRNNVERYAPAADMFLPHGYEVWMPEYPGFGKSTGPRSEKIMKEDAELVYRLACSRFAADSIIFYGRSMGSGPATWLASQVDCRRLILETPYSSIPDLMQSYAFIYPVKWMSKYDFDNVDCLPKVHVPVTILHGTNDRIIPIGLARKLAKAAPENADLIEVSEGGHNNLSEFLIFHHKIDSLLQ